MAHQSHPERNPAPPLRLIEAACQATEGVLVSRYRCSCSSRRPKVAVFQPFQTFQRSRIIRTPERLKQLERLETLERFKRLDPRFHFRPADTRKIPATTIIAPVTVRQVMLSMRRAMSGVNNSTKTT